MNLSQFCYFTKCLEIHILDSFTFKLELPTRRTFGILFCFILASVSCQRSILVTQSSPFTILLFAFRIRHENSYKPSVDANFGIQTYQINFYLQNVVNPSQFCYFTKCCEIHILDSFTFKLELPTRRTFRNLSCFILASVSCQGSILVKQSSPFAILLFAFRIRHDKSYKPSSEANFWI